MGTTNRHPLLQLPGLQLQGHKLALLALVVAASVCSAQQPAAPPSATPSAASTADAAAPQVAQAPPDAPVLPPKVVCTGDQMTIAANNSTLSSVLAEVHRCMGTKIDLPDGAGEKRMFDRIGPGPASQVIDELLSNTGYNYIVGSNPSNQEKIESIMLLARSADAASLTAAVTDNRALTPNRRAFLQMHQASVPHPMTEADEAAAAEIANPAPTPAPAAEGADAATTPAATDSSHAPPADTKPAETAPAQPDTPPATPPPTNNHPATTEDQITNMQQMFELRKQMNQPQPPAPPQ